MEQETLWLNCELMSLLKTKPKCNRHGEVDVSRLCRGAVRKAKADLKIGQRCQKPQANVHQVHKKQGEIEGKYWHAVELESESVTSNTEQDEFFKTSFSSVFTSTAGPLALLTAIQVGTKTNVPSEVKELMCEPLQEPGPYTLMNPKDTYPRALQEMANITVRTLFIAFKKLWRLEDVPEN